MQEPKAMEMHRMVTPSWALRDDSGFTIAEYLTAVFDNLKVDHLGAFRSPNS